MPAAHFFKVVRLTRHEFYVPARKDNYMETQPPGGTDPYPFEDKYQALPPLDSDDYLSYLRRASREALPPEVLVRAFRQLPAGGMPAQATLGRLFRREGDRYENLTTV